MLTIINIDNLYSNRHDNPQTSNQPLSSYTMTNLIFNYPKILRFCRSYSPNIFLFLKHFVSGIIILNKIVKVLQRRIFRSRQSMSHFFAFHDESLASRVKELYYRRSKWTAFSVAIESINFQYFT